MIESQLTEFCHTVGTSNTYDIVIPSIVVLPVLPAQRRKYFQSFGLPKDAIEQLVGDKPLGDFLTAVLNRLHDAQFSRGLEDNIFDD